MRKRHLIVSTLGSALLAFGALVALTPPAHAADTDVKINEVESQDGFPDDWVELYNTGASAVDISGYVIKDNNDGHVFAIPPATSIAGHGFFTIDIGGLGDSDSARFFEPDGTTLLDTFSWGPDPAHGTFSRCPDGTGGFVDATPSKDAANVCDTVNPWPGGTAVSTVDGLNAFGDDVSGLAYDTTGAAPVLWAVQNTQGTLYKLVDVAGTWTPDTSWTAAGLKNLHYPGGAGGPDTEGLTLTDAGAAGGFFASSERDSSNSSVSRPSILEYQDSASTSLDAVHEWDLTADLPTLDPNMALEGIAWVPDGYLVANGFKDQHTNAAYDPATYANHGTGLFFVGVEQTGDVYAYALDLTSNSYTRVAVFASGFPSVMDLNYDPANQKLWVVCDDTCGGRTAQFGVDGSGAFTSVARYERPSAEPNLNNEGFAITPDSLCASGSKPVFYADDSNDDGHTIRQGSIACGAGHAPVLTAKVTSAAPKSASGWYRGPVTVSFTCAPNPWPLTGTCPAPTTLSASGAGQSVSRSIGDVVGHTTTAGPSGINIDQTAPTVKIKGVKKGKTYPKLKKAKCKASDALSGLNGKCQVKQKKKGSKVTVTATATDNAGNLTTVKLTYKVKKPKK